MVHIYALQLENDKYYIGKTDNPKFRLQTHFNFNGSQWTKKYRPIRVIEIKKKCDDYDEDKITRQYMDKYGIDNVRGGSFVSVTLDKKTREVLNKMSDGTNDKCFKCGKKGHFAKNCTLHNQEYYSDEYDSEDYVWQCEFCGKEFETEKGCIFHQNVHCKKKPRKKQTGIYETFEPTCFRCGYEGHYASNCYAKRHINGYYLN